MKFKSKTYFRQEKCVVQQVLNNLMPSSPSKNIIFFKFKKKKSIYTLFFIYKSSINSIHELLHIKLLIGNYYYICHKYRKFSLDPVSVKVGCPGHKAISKPKTT